MIDWNVSVLHVFWASRFRFVISFSILFCLFADSYGIFLAIKRWIRKTNSMWIQFFFCFLRSSYINDFAFETKIHSFRLYWWHKRIPSIKSYLIKFQNKMPTQMFYIRVWIVIMAQKYCLLVWLDAGNLLVHTHTHTMNQQTEPYEQNQWGWCVSERVREWCDKIILKYIYIYISMKFYTYSMGDSPCFFRSVRWYSVYFISLNVCHMTNRRIHISIGVALRWSQSFGKYIENKQMNWHWINKRIQ